MRSSVAARAVSLLAGVASVLGSAKAWAYRPFDGTDADVSAPHEFEFEIQTVGYSRAGGDRAFVPGGVLNYGVFPRAELVLEGFAVLPEASGPHRLTDTGLFLKTVVREGCLQDASGPSFATEVGPLLPVVHDATGWGASAAGILSTCIGDALVVHWNVVAELLRQTYDFDLFAGAILEPPPARWVVRPVAELFVERDFGGVQTYSVLAGTVWRVTEDLAVDVAVRDAVVNGQNVGELRAGFSLGVTAP